jgi:hypothetical protein
LYSVENILVIGLSLSKVQLRTNVKCRCGSSCTLRGARMLFWGCRVRLPGALSGLFYGDRRVCIEGEEGVLWVVVVALTFQGGRRL